MASLIKCLRLQDFSAEDAAEIRGFIAAKGSDVDGVAAYIEALEAEVAALAAEVAEKMGVDVQSKTHIFDRFLAGTTGGGTLFQSAPPVSSDAFEAWAGTDEIIEGAEIQDVDFSAPGPFVIRAYHGTTHAFEAFDASLRGNMEGAYGAVNYFTTDEQDANQNYTSGGPDLTNRIIQRAEQLESNEGLDTEASMEAARAELAGDAEQVLEVYVRTEKPFVVGGEKSPFAEFRDFDALNREALEIVADNEGLTVEEVEANRDEHEDAIDEARWEIEANTPSPLYEAIETVAMQFEVDAAELYAAVAEYGMEGARHTEIEKALQESETLMYAEDPETGAMAGQHMLGQIVRELGFDSIIMLDPAERFMNMGIGSGTAHVHVFDQNNTNIKSVDNRGTYDPNDPRILYQSTEAEPRAAITFPSGGLDQGETIIRLFESADLSSLLHESGHFFLKAFRTLAEREDAPQGMRDDLAAINAFLGHENGSYGVDAQEKWARGFEAYMMEGKAPSLALADAFSRFKAWLIRIYKTATGLNVKLTPEIREAMDRMLATDEEIKEARNEAGMDPLFTDAGAAGMSKAAFAIYQRLARRATEQAEQSLLEKTMAKIRRTREKWFKTERKAVRAEVEAAANTRPEYRLIKAMAGDDTFGRLDRDELVARFGEGVIAEIGRNKLGGKRAVYGGDVSVDEAAEFFGFASGEEMIRVLQNTRKFKDFVEQETDAIMADRYGDPLTDGSIEEEALAAIHTDQQAKTVASEARQLAKRIGKDERGITARVFRQRARLMLGRMAVREAIRPARFLQAERAAARAAEQAFAKVAGGGGREALAAAQRFKEQQLLNHYLYLEARDLEKYVASGRERMRKYGKKSVRKKLEGGYIEQIDAILADYDFRVTSQRALDRRESLHRFVARMKTPEGQPVLDEAGQPVLDQNGQPVIGEGREAQLAIDDRLLDEANRRHYTRLTVDELQGLFDTIDNLDHLGRFKQKLIEAAQERELNAVADEIATNMRENVSGSPPGRGSETSGEKRKRTFRDMLNWTLNADTLLREIDGFLDLGAAYRHIKAPIDAAMARLVERRQKMRDELDALYEVFSTAEMRDMNVKRMIKDAGVSLSKWDAIAVALNTGNEQNYQRLTSGGKHSFTPGQVDAIVATLDERDWRYVQSMWDYINSFWPEIEAKERRQTGTAPKKVAAKAMLPVHSFLKGGYYPLRYDNRLSGAADDFLTKDLAETLMGGRFGKAQTRDGHTKARNDSVKEPVALDISVAHQHLQQVIYDLELAEVLGNSWKILQKLKPEFMEKGRVSDFEALELWLQDTASGEQIMARGWEKFLRHLRSGFTVSRLALNISTALIQPSGLFQSMVQLGKADMAKGFMSYMTNPSRWSKDVLEVSAFMRERVKTFERDVFNVVGDVQDSPITGPWQKFMRDTMMPASFWMMQKVQFYAVDMPTWVAAYEQEIARSGDEGRARMHADQMVRRAQGSGLMSDRGMLERGTTQRDSRQKELPRMLTALGSYMFAKFNIAYEKTAGTDFRSPKQILSLALDYALLFTLEAFFYQVVKGGLPFDEEDEDKRATWAEWAAKETALSALSTVPVLREGASALSGFGGGGIYGGSVETLARPFIQVGQGELDESLVKSLINFGGVMLHLPAGQVSRSIDALFDKDLSVNEDISLWEFFMGERKA